MLDQDQAIDLDPLSPQLPAMCCRYQRGSRYLSLSKKRRQTEDQKALRNHNNNNPNRVYERTYIHRFCSKGLQQQS